MLEKTTIARPYAEAAFAQAQEEKKLTDWSDMLGLLSVVVSDVNMRLVLKSPKLDGEQLCQFIFDVCSGSSLSKTVKSFVKILIDSGRIELLPEIYSLFDKEKAIFEGVEELYVTTPYPLDEKQIDNISTIMSRRLGKEVNMNIKEDRGLIGGVVIRAGDSVIDVSLRGRLKELNSIFAQ